MTGVQTCALPIFCFDNKLDPIIIDLTSKDRHKEMLAYFFHFSKKFHLRPERSLLQNFVYNRYKLSGNVLTGFGQSFPDSEEFHSKLGDEVIFDSYDYFFNLQHSNHPGPFFTFTPEILTAQIKEVDYTLNCQMAKAKLYNLHYRSKLDDRLSSNLQYADCKTWVDRIQEQYRTITTNNQYRISIPNFYRNIGLC